MPARFQLRRTKRKFDDTDLDRYGLKFGEPLYFDNADSPNNIAIVIGDDSNTPITKLPRFTPLPPDKDGTSYNDVYFIKEGDKYYLVDKDGNKISAVGTGGSEVYRGTLIQSNWVAENDYYVQTITNTDVTQTDTLVVDVLIGDDVQNYGSIFENWKYIVKFDSYDGGIKFFAYGQPQIDLNFQAQKATSGSSGGGGGSSVQIIKWEETD